MITLILLLFALLTQPQEPDKYHLVYMPIVATSGYELAVDCIDANRQRVECTP
jgi:hypothetical protein